MRQVKLPNHEHIWYLFKGLTISLSFSQETNPFICSIGILSSDEALLAALQEKNMPPLPDCIRFLCTLFS